MSDEEYLSCAFDDRQRHGLPFFNAAVSSLVPGYMHTFVSGLVKLLCRLFREKYQGASFRALKREDARQQFIGLPSEYGGRMKPVYPPGVGTSYYVFCP